MLEFRLLGRFDVRVDGKSLVIPSRLAQSLLAYLLLNRTTRFRREKLAGLFWPDTSETKARHSLRHELWRLRKALDNPSSTHCDLLLGDDLSVGIDPGSHYWLDVAVLESTHTSNPTPDDLMHSLEVYQGDLLPDFYDEWLTLERERLHTLFEQQVARLLEQLGAEQRWDDILCWGERWITLGRSPEPAYRALMLAHHALGNRSEVALLFERCVATLKADLGVEPSVQTRALYERLAHGPDAQRSSLASPPASTLPTFVVAEEGESSRDIAPLRSSAPSSFGDVAPYKGLQYFDEADADLFFGREKLVAALVSHLAEHHWLTVVGASGCGKSSLVRAGLLPALKQGVPEGECTWDIQVLTPTMHPLEALAVCVTRRATSVLTTTTLMDDLARDPRTLRMYSHLTFPEGRRLLLVIDQFEELFTLCREERERESYIDNLLLATAPELDRPIHVVVALRADFYAHAAQYANLREALARRQEYIGPMTADELRRAIEGPAQRGGWELEAGLVDLILSDVGTEPGALPLLSHALLETWKRRRGRRLTLEGYAGCGGVRSAIAQTAETVFRQLPPEKQAIARHIFLQLTELGEGTQDTRRRVTIEQLVPPAGDVAAVRDVLNTLAEARLVTLGESTAEVAHEALIREWPTLREWLNQNREGLRLHRRLTEATEAWLKSNRDEGDLYRGARLVQAQEWARGRVQELNSPEREFLDAAKARREREESEREAQRERELDAARHLAEVERQRAQAERTRAEEHVASIHHLRRRAVYLVSAVMVAAVLALVAIVFADQSRQNATRAENERRTAFVRELSVNAVNNLAIDPERSILLALQAVSVSTASGQPVLREAEEALHRAVQASRLQFTLHGHAAGTWDIAFSPDGKRLATASLDKTAKVWDAATGKELFTLCCHDDTIYALAVSPDGTRLATGSIDKTAKVWDAVTGQELLTLRGHTDYMRGIAFSPDGTRIATVNLDKTARIWDAVTGKELLTLVGHTGGVSGVAFSPDGKRLVTGSWSDEPEHTAKVWDAASGQVLLTLTGHTSSVFDAAFSPDGKRVATGSGDGTARVWDSTTGRLLATAFVRSVVMSVAFSPDGSRLATGSTEGTAKVWDASTGELLETLAGHSGGLMGVAYSPDGTRLGTASQDGTAKVWDVSTAGSREWLTIVGHNGLVRYLAFSADGSRLATSGADKTAKIWDAATGKQLQSFEGHSGDVKGVALSSDGRRLATVSMDQTVKVWDAATGKQLFSLAAPSYPSPLGPRIVFSPDSRLIATSTAGGTAKVWDAATGQERLTVCCPALPVRGVAFSPDGTRLATAGLDRLAKVWDAATGKELLTLSGHTAEVWAVVYSRDGRRLATSSSDGTARLWDAITGKELFTFSGLGGSAFDVALSPDGMHLATAGGDGKIKVWDISTTSAQSEQPLTLYNPKGSIVMGVVFSPDGKRLAVSAADGTARIYALPLEDIVSIAKSRLTRALTEDECRKFLHVEQCPPP